MEILIKLFDVIIPVYVIIGIGYYIGKKIKNLIQNLLQILQQR